MHEPILDEEEICTLRRLLDALIPADHDPGALEAGVDHFVLGLLRRESGLRDVYRAGLQTWKSVDLPVLHEALSTREGEPFLRLLIQHAHEGFYGDPGQGGNRDGASWAMVGFRVTA